MGVVAMPDIAPAVVKQSIVERVGLLPGVLTTVKGATPVVFSKKAESLYFAAW